MSKSYKDVNVGFTLGQFSSFSPSEVEEAALGGSMFPRSLEVFK